MQPLSIVPPASLTDEASDIVPPLTPHQTLGLPAKPQTAGQRRLSQQHSQATPTDLGGTGTPTDLDTPPSRLGSRPGSAHSAPMLDVSIDRHYEFDTRTPTGELDLKGIGEALPRQWNRPYLGYNPRLREREMGRAAQLARTERVFSDSEIYSPVFPRGRPPAEDPPAEEEVSARVRAMKKEFKEYREQQQLGTAAAAAAAAATSSASASSQISPAASNGSSKDPKKLESLI